MAISKADLVGQLSSETGIRKKAVKEIIDGLLNHVGSHLAAGKKVRFTGFGTFEVRKRRPRVGMKPGTTTRIQIPARKFAAFKPGKRLKDTIR